MGSDAPTIEALRGKALAQRGPVVVVDVMMDSRFDRARGRFCGCLRVAVVLAAAGHRDSRYREAYLDTLPGEGPDEVIAALAVVRGLAERLGVAVHPSGPPVPGEPRWIGLQGPPPMRSWRFGWRTIAWCEQGSEVHESGEIHVDAESGDSALTAVERVFAARLARPYRVTLDSAELGPLAERSYARAYPETSPPVNTLRAWAVERGSLAAVLRRLAETPSTALDRMVAIEAAFCVDLRALAPVAMVLAGAMADAALDAALGPALERTYGQWSLPIRLLEAHAQGRSIAPVLHEFHARHGLGGVALVRAMREAFGLSLMSTKRLVDMVCSGVRGDELDAAVQAVVASVRAGERDDRRALDAALDAFPARKQ